MSTSARRAREAVVVAASIGGIDALRTILGALTPAFAMPLIIVQHTASDRAGALCDVLAARSGLPVAIADPREPPAPGRAWLAPPGYHLLVEAGPRFALSVDGRVSCARPSADVLFESAADVWRSRLIGIVLTGSNEDGAHGLLAVRSRRGLAIVQDPAEAERRDMPDAALKLAGADHVVGVREIGPLLMALCHQAARR